METMEAKKLKVKRKWAVQCQIDGMYILYIEYTKLGLFCLIQHADCTAYMDINDMACRKVFELFPEILSYVRKKNDEHYRGLLESI